MSIKVGDTMTSRIKRTHFLEKKKSRTDDSYDRYIYTYFQSVIVLLKLPNLHAKNSYGHSLICQKTLAIEAAFYDDSVTVSNQPLQPMLSVYTKEL